jgi:hypothetical protein
MPKGINWIDEERATKILGYKKHWLRTLTRDPKRKTLPIRTSKINHKTILYSGDDIQNYINKNSIA